MNGWMDWEVHVNLTHQMVCGTEPSGISSLETGTLKKIGSRWYW